MKDRFWNQKGFTLIEVVAVLVIVAILTAVAISRGIATDEVNAQTEVDTLKSHLRYAQYLAMNDIDPIQWGISLGGSSYTLVRDNAGTVTSPYNLPGESSATHDFSPVSATAVTVLFDEWGSPGAADINIAIGGQTIIVTAETGYIP